MAASWARRAPCVAAAAAATLVAGCGGSGAPKVRVAGGVCSLPAIKAVAHAFGVPPGRVANVRGTGNNGAPQCTMRTHLKDGTAVEVIANDEVTQGAYMIVERTNDEATQIFGTARMEPAPVTLLHLGLEASWFPQWQWLVSTDGYRVLTMTVEWPGARQAAKIAVARAVSLVYLHTPHGKRASAVSKTYP